MKSLAKLFRYGPGPSSSHTIGPFNAALRFGSLVSNHEPITVTFYGSLAYTSRGHHSESAVRQALSGHEVTIVNDTQTKAPHPLTMRFSSSSLAHVYFSLGGGEISSPTDPSVNEENIYPFRNYHEFISAYIASGANDIPSFCRRYEGPEIDTYLDLILHKMFLAIESGLQKLGKIPANSNPRLQVMRSARDIFQKAESLLSGQGKRELYLSAYAYAVAEGSACGEITVTSPTCGSSGVLPSVLYYLHHNQGVPFTQLKDSLYIAGMIGNTVKQNASIAGSVGGCQAEIGTATSMASAALAYADGLSLHQIEYGAEVAMEHFLGLSCDPVDGYVVIPCIERNGVGAIRAYDSYLYAKHIEPIRKNQVSFDDVVAAMKITGDSLDERYKETSLGGLAEILKQ